jgi:hypothetical protein
MEVMRKNNRKEELRKIQQNENTEENEILIRPPELIEPIRKLTREEKDEIMKKEIEIDAQKIMNENRRPNEDKIDYISQFESYHNKIFNKSNQERDIMNNRIQEYMNLSEGSQQDKLNRIIHLDPNNPKSLASGLTRIINKISGVKNTVEKPIVKSKRKINTNVKFNMPLFT